MNTIKRLKRAIALEKSKDNPDFAKIKRLYEQLAEARQIKY